jgi:hypothetical protein
MKIYLDIDGTLIHEDLTENYGKPARGLLRFLEALRGYDTYWLTTHCMDGDPENARRIMKKVVPEEYYKDIDRIKPTEWKDNKTEALDLDSDFIWFDNDIFEEEWKELERCKENQGVVQVDIKENPEHLIEITRDVLE